MDKNRPAKLAWGENKNGFIKSFLRFKDSVCPKLMLFGSVARGDDNIDSDIDLLILTGIGFDISRMVSIKNALINDNPCDVPVHISFLNIGMEKWMLKREGIIIC